MRKFLTIFAVWIGFLLTLIVFLDLVSLIPYLSSLGENDLPRRMTTPAYSVRFFVEAIIYSGIGVLIGFSISKPETAGLFALAIGVAYVAYVQMNGGLWYYMAAHSRTIDEFFFTAPILAPVIFVVGACLIWKLVSKRTLANAL